jgi:hypothetical protein
MDIKEVSEENRKAEQEILEIAKDFMKKTGCAISKLELDRIEFIGSESGGEYIYGVHIDASIP